MSHKCKICGQPTIELIDNQMKCTYDMCESCLFTYRQEQYHLTTAIEKERYSMHENNFESVGYVNMFKTLIHDFIEPHNIKGKGLEYGSGPGPVLKVLLEDLGNEMYDYDPYFNNNTEYLNHQYDFITSTEVFEHFSDPMKEINHLDSLLKKGGYLIIMTSFRLESNERFLGWYYKRDETHVSFYALKTFEEIAQKLNYQIIDTNNKNSIVLKKR